MDILKLILQSAIVFVLGAVCFDTVHFLLHKFEKSRFAFLRFLAGLHGVHHKFLDTRMQIQREFTRGNLLHHVTPEFTTAVLGMVTIGFISGWWTAVAIVTGIRSLMFCVYVFQKGEDYTHRPLSRIHAQRSLIFVGPRYHALHHVWENQYYSSFVNIFDFVWGTNCQLEGRRFLVTDANGTFATEMAKVLKRRGGLVETADSVSDETLARTDVLVLCHTDDATSVNSIERFRELTLNRLVPGEVWRVAQHDRELATEALGNRSDPDLILRHISCSTFKRRLLPERLAVLWSLFFIKRGFRYVP